MESSKKQKNSSGSSVSATFKIGSISLAFLIIGYQSAMVMGRAFSASKADAAAASETAVLSSPAETAAVPAQPVPPPPQSTPQNAPKATTVAPRATPAKKRSQPQPFPFNPNTADVEELQRLGFSPKQAAAIDNYRKKGGRFRRPGDFAKSFVVSEEMFARLEPYIRIPKVNLNTADSAALDALPGIGPYLVRKILEHRAQIGGFMSPEQLMDIDYFDRERYEDLKDLVTCGEDAPAGP